MDPRVLDRPLLSSPVSPYRRTLLPTGTRRNTPVVVNIQPGPWPSPVNPTTLAEEAFAAGYRRGRAGR